MRPPWRNICWSASRPAPGCSAPRSCCARRRSTSSSATSSRDNRPDWFLAISPHKKVPVLRIDDQVSLFESNAIAEYLDETIAPRLHPEDPVGARRQPRLDRLRADLRRDGDRDRLCRHARPITTRRRRQIPVPFERLEQALAKQGSGPFFNGAEYSLVDAAYAPFLQRYIFLDRIRPLGHIEKFPRLKAWSEALMDARLDPFASRRPSSRRCIATMSGAATSGYRSSSSRRRWRRSSGGVGGAHRAMTTPSANSANQGTGQIGMAAAVSIGIGGMVGAGIFSILGVVAQAAGNAMWLAFAIGGVVALLSTYSYAKLGATFPVRRRRGAFPGEELRRRRAGRRAQPVHVGRLHHLARALCHGVRQLRGDLRHRRRRRRCW